MEITLEQGSRVFTAVADQAGRFELAEAVLPATIEVRLAGFTTIRTLVTTSPVTVTLTPSPIRESVVVSGAVPNETWRRPSTGTTVLGAEAMQAIPAVTLDETLRVVSGFSLFRRSSSRASNPTTHGVTMRGLSASGASRGLVLLDGVPLTEGFGSWVTWTRIPALALQSVEIDRGSHGSTFGSDALGGVIALATVAPVDSGATAVVSGGSNGVRALDMSGGGPRGDATLFGALSWFSTDGTIPTAPESAGPVDVQADAEWVNGLGKARFGSAVDRITLTGWASRDERGNGTPLQRNRMAGGAAGLAYSRMLRGTTIGAHVSLAPNAYRQSFSVVAGNRRSETPTFTQYVNTTTTRAVAEAGRVIPGGFLTARYTNSRATADFRERRSTSTLFMNLRDDSDAVSMHVAWNAAPTVSLGAGVRREWRGAPDDSASRDGATVGHLTGSWRWRPNVTVRGAVSSSHRWPTLNELVRNFQVGAVLTRANPNLLPERSRSAEVAVSVAERYWQASAGGFWTVVEDAISNFTVQSAPTIIRERRNAGEAHARGLELDFTVRPIERVNLRASALVVDSRFRDSIEPALEGNRLPQVPRASVSLSGDARLHEWISASFAWRAISSQFDDDRNTFLLSDARQLDLRFAAGTSRVSFEVNIENAADARIEVGRTPLVTVAPGRAVRVALRLKR